MRLHPRKRPGALVRAIGNLVATLPGHRIEARIFGDGVSRQSLQRLVTRSGLAGVVRIEGWKDRETIRSALHHSDIFVMPSRLEAFGIAALEARCAGVPVVAMRQGGARDFLLDGADSMLVDSDAGMLAALRRLATDPAELRRLTAGCATLPRGAGWPAVLDRHERAYADAGAERGQPAPR
jgi:glycosyltransferase involved in cell wall biosynthesis